MNGDWLMWWIFWAKGDFKTSVATFYGKPTYKHVYTFGGATLVAYLLNQSFEVHGVLANERPPHL